MISTKLSLVLLLVSAFFVIGIFCVLVIFAVRYRRRPGNEMARELPDRWRLEIIWTAIPLCLTLGAFAWGAHQYLARVEAPQNPLGIYVVGKQWMWEMEYQNGVREINELHVPVDRDVELTMISQDVIHSFFIPDFRVKFDVLPGRYTKTWFRAEKTGTFRLVCTQYCGTDHSLMIGTVTVLNKDDFELWNRQQVLSRQAPENRTEQLNGSKIFAKNNCAACHDSAAQTGPSLDHLFGHPVALQDGRTIIADESYLRESILAPQMKIAAGYANTMPPYIGLLTESEIVDLIVYLRARSQPEGGL